MNRRSFFAAMAGTPVVATSEAQSVGSIDSLCDGKFHRIGPWNIVWMDWRAVCFSDMTYGVWCAYPVDGNGLPDESRWMLYSTSGGIVAGFLRGEVFNTVVQNEAGWVDRTTPEKKKVEARDAALAKLLTAMRSEKVFKRESPNRWTRPDFTQAPGKPNHISDLIWDGLVPQMRHRLGVRGAKT